MKIFSIRRQGKLDTSNQFRVRRNKIEISLQWLKENNPAYEGIIISQEHLQQLLIVDGIPNIETSEYKNTVCSKETDPAPEQIHNDEIGESVTTSGLILLEEQKKKKEKRKTTLNK